MGSRQSPTVALSSRVGRKTQACPLRGVELGMGAHDPERGSAHSRRGVSLREGVHCRCPLVYQCQPLPCNVLGTLKVSGTW